MAAGAFRGKLDRAEEREASPAEVVARIGVEKLVALGVEDELVKDRRSASESNPNLQRYLPG